MIQVAVIIYFSRSGQNKQSGALQYINVGNTAIVAGKLEQQIGCKSVALQTIEPYETDYEATLQRSKKEEEQDKLVEIEPSDFDLTAEKQIFLGFPIWWSTIPNVVKTFLASNDLSETEIYPFCTHEGSQFGHSLDVIKLLAPQARVHSGLAVRGSKVYRSDQAITNWLKCIDVAVIK